MKYRITKKMVQLEEVKLTKFDDANSASNRGCTSTHSHKENMRKFNKWVWGSQTKIHYYYSSWSAQTLESSYHAFQSPYFSAINFKLVV